MKKVLAYLVWVAVAIAAALCLGAIALNRGEHINSLWLVAAAACTYVLGFRFYAKFIAARVMLLNDQRATPAEPMENGPHIEPTNKSLSFAHHFAAVSGPSQLVDQLSAA